MPAPENRSRDPLHGVTLEAIVRHLVEHHGWREMGHRIPIRCFRFDPSIQSSLTFLRRTPWARQKVEEWYLDDQFLADRTAPVPPADPMSGSPSEA